MAVLRPLYLFIQSENSPKNPNKRTERQIDKRVREINIERERERES
jgi:hypothetical protein